MGHRAGRTIRCVAAAIGLAAVTAGAADLRTLTREIFAVPSTTGNEQALAAKVRGLLPGGLAIETDGLGTIAVRFAGSPGPTLVVAPLDGYGYIVGGITPEGALTLDRPVAPPHGRFDGYLLGQPVVIWTARGAVRGVVSQPAMHLLTPERRKLLVDGFSLETTFVDIGVRSEAEARAKGVERLDPVTFPAVLTELAGNQWAGPGMGAKAVAAGLLAAAASAEARTGGGETVVAWAAQTKFMARGRGAVRPAVGASRAKARWQPARTVVVDVVAAGGPEGGPAPGRGPVLVVSKDETSTLRRALEDAAAAAGVSLQIVTAPDSPMTAPFAAAPSEVVTLALAVRFLNTPSEAVSLDDLQALADVLGRFLRTGGAR